MKTKNIFIGLFIVVVVIVISIANMQQGNQKITSNNDKQLLETSFDKKITLPSTKIYFSYPSSGFYGHGADVMVSEAERYLTIESEYPYVAEKGSEFVVLNASAQKLPSGQSSLEDFVESFNQDSIIGKYASINGEYKEINGIKFYIVKVSEDAIIWNAWTVVNEDVITITFSYKASIGPAKEDGLLQNDQLFQQILETFHLQ